MATGMPLAKAPPLLITWTVDDVLVVDEETVNMAVAMTPLASAVLLMPNSKHL